MGRSIFYQEDIHSRIKIEIVSNEKYVAQVKDIILANVCCGLAGDGCLSDYILDEHIMFPPDERQDLK